MVRRTPATRATPSLPPAPPPAGAGPGRPRIAVAVSRYNWTVTSALLEGARTSFRSAVGADLPPEDAFYAPGAFEIVALCHAAAESRAFDGVVALGCIIKGETIHDQVLAHAVTQALANIPLVTGVPVTLGVLTVNSGRQAKDRAGGRQGNKGAEAMDALLLTLAELRRLWARAGTDGRPAPALEIDLRTLAAPSPPDKLAKGGR
ncbi:MAG: 6,7-dimethyl-8-ribityllumazine synthase [Phycisphaerales bacterium]|nr:6,7-dimethyl-8-ribityllumazine synthase [Phycisphaerales bacterium]